MKILLSRRQRERCRLIARESWLEADGDLPKARGLAKAKLKQDLGSTLLFLTIGVLMLELIYYALKIWNEMKLREPPVEPQPYEPFGLTKE